MQPLVSVIVPCFNEDVGLVKQSLVSLRRQTESNFECIFVDESTDSSLSEEYKNICSLDPRFLYIHPERRMGLSGSLNLGISVARGEYIARFDSDDICDVNRIKLQLQFFKNNPTVGVLGGWMRIIDNEGHEISHRKYPVMHDEIVRSFVYTNAIAHPAVMFRREVILTVEGPYRLDFRYSEDLELWLRLLNNGVQFANLSEFLVGYRQQSSSRHRDNWKFNFKARKLHISQPYKFRKYLVLILLRAWVILPNFFQELLYKKMVFK